MASGDEEFAALQQTLDAAVLDPARWREVCDRLGSYVGGVGTVIVPEDVERQGPWQVASSSLDELMHVIFRDGWHLRNYRRRSVPIIKSRGHATDFDFADATSLKHEPFYAEFLAPLKLSTFVGIAIPAGGETYIAAIEREIGAAVPDTELFTRIERVKPALAAAARASVALARLRYDTWEMLASDATRGIYLVDHLGRLIDRNAASEQHLGNIVQLKQRRIELIEPLAETHFRNLLAAALSGSPVMPPPVFTGLAAATPAVVEVVPLPPSMRFFHTSGAALVVVRAIGSSEETLPTLLRRNARLTGAEVRIAMALFEGQSIIEYAASAGLTEGTARQQVKSVLRKTQTNRQAELLTWMRKLQAAGR